MRNFANTLTVEAIAGIVIAVIIFVILLIIIIKKRPRRRGDKYFASRWKALQARCSDKGQWATAIFEADDLLGEALQKSKVKGKSLGERLVSAQNLFTDNDAVWFGHKLRTKLDAKPDTKLTKTDVKKALFGIRQALKDLEVL